MRNLKRVLTLVMAVAMMMSLLVVGAGAAFPDQDKIENTDAVNMNVALGIIKGRDTGVFDPTGNVTRAEMAKMICIVLNGGNEPVVGAKVTPTFKDIKGHWAEGYIEYCAALGIVAGMGDGTFAPNANVTGTQAAKMLLVSLGYDAVFEVFNGASWAVRINVAASQKNLYDELAIDPNAALNRDDAAQMVWNTLNATEVKYTYSLTTVNGQLMNIQSREDKTTDLLENKFKAESKEGILTDATWNKTSKKFNYEVSTVATTSAPATVLTSVKNFASETDYSHLFGMNVKVVSKKSSSTVYGVYAEDSKVLATGIISDISDYSTTSKSLKIDDVKFNFDNYDKVNNNRVVIQNDQASFDLAVVANQAAFDAMDPNFTIKAIDADNNGKIDWIVIQPFTVAKVTYVGKDTMTVGNNSIDLDDEDYSIAKGIAKNDYVKVVDKANSANGVNTITKLDVISGKVEATRANEAKINGTWYKLATGVSALKLGDAYDASVVGTYIYNAEKTSNATALSDVILITDAQNVKFGTSEAKAFFTDGTSQVINISKVEGDDVTNGNKPVAGMYTFTIKSGKYEVEAVNADNLCGTDGYAVTGTAFDGDTDRLGAYYIADNAVIYVAKDSGAGYKVYTGVQAKTWADFTAASGGNAPKVLYNTVNGLRTIQVGFITMTGSSLPSAAGDENYGYITSKPETVKIDGDTYISYTIWTKDGSKNVLEDSSTITVAKGMVITYDDLGNGEIENVVDVSATIGAVETPVAIVGIGGKYMEAFNADGSQNGVTTIDKDTVILYVNTSKNTGVGGGEIAPANQLANGAYVMNAWVVARGTSGDDAKKADLIVYDVNNDIDDLANTVGTGAAGYAVAAPTKTGATANGITIASIVADRNFAVEGESVKYTVTYSGTATLATTLTFTAGANSTVPATATVSIANAAVVPAGTTVTFVVTNVAGAVGAADASVATTP